jgi:hypothetical protein
MKNAKVITRIGMRRSCATRVRRNCEIGLLASVLALFVTQAFAQTANPIVDPVDVNQTVLLEGSDSQPLGGGHTTPAFNKANQNTPLTAEDVKNIITKAQVGMTDPVTVGMQIFNSLGDSITVAGDTLRQALRDSSIAVDGPLSPLVAAAQNITKIGSQVTVTNTEELKTEFGGTAIKFKSLVTFVVGTDGGFPTISNIHGAAAHKVFWFDITQIQLRQDQGRRFLHVVTAGGTREFPIV